MSKQFECATRGGCCKRSWPLLTLTHCFSLSVVPKSCFIWPKLKEYVKRSNSFCGCIQVFFVLFTTSVRSQPPGPTLIVLRTMFFTNFGRSQKAVIAYGCFLWFLRSVCRSRPPGPGTNPCPWSISSN